jgi:hypothetical protein
MSIDDYARWLSRVTLAVAIIMIGWGLSVVLSQPVTSWFAASATIWMALLLISAFWHLRGSVTAIAALALATAVVSRLFSILRLNPPASIAEGPGELARQPIRRPRLVLYQSITSCVLQQAFNSPAPQSQEESHCVPTDGATDDQCCQKSPRNSMDEKLFRPAARPLHSFGCEDKAKWTYFGDRLL